MWPCGRVAVWPWAVWPWGRGAVGPWGRGAVGPWGRVIFPPPGRHFWENSPPRPEFSGVSGLSPTFWENSDRPTQISRKCRSAASALPPQLSFRWGAEGVARTVPM